MSYCYILRNLTEQYKNHSYVGFTVNPQRRIRQHNGELVGGAKYTKKGTGHWEIACLITGFPDRQNALQCEWAIKHQKTSGKGCERRIRGLINLLKKDRWTNNSIYNNHEQQFIIKVLPEYIFLFDNLNLNNVTVSLFDQIKKEVIAEPLPLLSLSDQIKIEVIAEPELTSSSGTGNEFVDDEGVGEKPVV